MNNITIFAEPMIAGNFFNKNEGIIRKYHLCYSAAKMKDNSPGDILYNIYHLYEES